MYESKHHPLASKKVFRKRLLNSFLLANVLLFFSLMIGVLGYHFTNDLGWTDSLLNASMILTGMGPVDPMHNEAAKLFASFYAIFSGVAFLTTVGVLLAPIIHRIFHKFHIEEK
ncbi:MAG TPA: hypothetical protein VL651_15655 [Bacteroidia bacterium]|jgi:putative effector of murein hydrolase|nr:hypothetical protein [Bacteroidia bacterium]